MPVMEFLFFLQKAREKEREDHIRAQWIAMLPYMSLKQLEYMSFEQYYDKVTGRNIDTRSTEEIIRDIEAAHRRAGMEVGLNGI